MHRRMEKKTTGQEEPPGNTAVYEEANRKGKQHKVSSLPTTAHSLLKYFPYVVICALLFDRHRSSSSVTCQHPDKAAAPSAVTTDSQQKQTTDADKLLNNMQAMDWEIPAEIKEERHKECDGKKTSSTGGFCLTKKNHIGGNWMVDTDLGNHLRDHVFKGMHVVDLGAGLGHYGKIFREEGSPVKSWT